MSERHVDTDDTACKPQELNSNLHINENTHFSEITGLEIWVIKFRQEKDLRVKLRKDASIYRFNTGIGQYARLTGTGVLADNITFAL